MENDGESQKITQLKDQLLQKMKTLDATNEIRWLDKDQQGDTFWKCRIADECRLDVTNKFPVK